DTLAFFSIAFWRSTNPFMAANWPEIAWVDYVIKLSVSLLLFVPMYGVALNAIVNAMRRGGGVVVGRFAGRGDGPSMVVRAGWFAGAALVLVHEAVHGDVRPGDVGSVFRAQEGDGGSDCFGRALAPEGNLGNDLRVQGFL